MADILIKEQPQVKFSNLFDMLCQKYIENYNDIENLIKENINPGNLKYIRVDTVSGKKVLIQR